MSHLRPEDRKLSRSACRKGKHAYGEPQGIGGGIKRRVCEACGEVTIDLTEVEDAPLPGRSSRIAPRTSRDS